MVTISCKWWWTHYPDVFINDQIEHNYSVVLAVNHWTLLMNVFMGNTAGKGSDDAAGDKEEDEPAETAGTLTDLGANLSDELDIPLDLRWVNTC